MNISITRNPASQPKPPANALGFGNYFTDHMFLMDYSEQKGWHDPRIVPFGPISLHPSAVVLHYGAEIFEGLKAYRTPDGCVQMFRPTENIRRMNNSALRLCLPTLNEDDALTALKTFVDLERDWVPSAEGTSLYLRPFLFATDAKLGVHTPTEAMFVIIASPVGSYYKEGINPVRIIVETEDVRAVRGGTGYAKCGGNYAASTRAGDRASHKGFSQVLWLDGVERRYIEEVGTMNVMFKINGTVVTPSLEGGSVLPGVTRRSCIDLMRQWGVTVEERAISIDELMDAIRSGRLEEAWGTGTAAVISPIGELNYENQPYIIAGGQIGPFTKRLYDELTGIQWGTRPDPRGWICRA